MTVSVVVPTYNSASYVAEALQSVLDQTRAADEVVVVDDASDDETRRIVEEFGSSVRFIGGPHVGIAANRHRGWLATTGDLVAMCDADDVWLPTKLERQAALLETDDDLDAVYCLVDEFRSPELSEEDGPGRDLRRAWSAPIPSALLVRRSFVESVGGYDNEHDLAEGLSWYAQAREAKVRDFAVQEVLLRRRVHQSNYSRGLARTPSGWLTAMRRHIESSRV